MPEKRAWNRLLLLVLEEQADRNQINNWLDAFQAGLSLPMPTDEIWQGVRDIFAEKVAEDAQTRARIRQLTFQQGKFVSEVKPEFKETTSKFEMYYDFNENISKIQPHRYLAIRRGEKEEILQARVQVQEVLTESALQEIWLTKANVDFRQELQVALSDTYDRLLAPSIETEIRQELKQQADESSIELFSKNLRQLLMQPPWRFKSSHWPGSRFSNRNKVGSSRPHRAIARARCHLSGGTTTASRGVKTYATGLD